MSNVYLTQELRLAVLRSDHDLDSAVITTNQHKLTLELDDY